MESFFSRYKNVLVLIAVLLAQVVGLAVQVRRPIPGAPETGQVRLIRYWVVSLISPPERWVHSMGGGLRGVWSNYAYLRGVRQQNQDLKAEVNRLRIEQAGLAEDARQGQRLQQLLSFKEHYISTTQPAQVIGTAGSDVAHVLYIDKGSNDGLKPDMPVITPDGIVGKIRDVFPDTSQLLIISDQTSGAGVMLETSRIRGVLRGNSLGQPQIVNVAPDEQIKVGDRVLTSGGDGVFPRGLPVGVVERKVPDPDHDGYLALVVKPAANLTRLEEVLVITGVNDKMPAAEQRDLAQSAIEAASQKRAADILSERLPGLKDPNAPPTAPDATPEAPGGDPGRPPRPGVPLHPDRFSPATIPSANTMTPGGQTPRPASGTGAGSSTTGKSLNSAGTSAKTPGAGTTGSTGAGSATGSATGSAGAASKTASGTGTKSVGKPSQAPASEGTATRKPGAVSPEGSAPKPVQPKPAQHRPEQSNPANPAQPKPRPEQTRPQTAAPDAATPPGGRL